MSADEGEDEAENMIRQFAELTETDEAFAHYMLQENDFDLNRALTSFFNNSTSQFEDLIQQPAPSTLHDIATRADESSVNIPSETIKQQTAVKPENGQTNSSDDANVESIQNENNEEKQTQPDIDEHVNIGDAQKGSRVDEKSEAQVKKPDKENEQLPPELTLISWNIDGLDERHRTKRFTAVLYVIAKVNPEVIFLQEMIDPLLPMLTDLMAPMYNIYIQKSGFPYFCVSLVSKNINITHHEEIPFENSNMGRGMQIIEGKWHRLKLKLLNTHLESCKENSEQRRIQFGRCIERMIFMTAANPIETLAIFGGDLNIRDKEIGNNLPVSIKDAWITAGSKPEYRFTWDQQLNDNYEGRFGAAAENNRNWKGPKARFDRLFFAAPPDTEVDFHLEGTSRIRGPNCFASDHFAMVCRFLQAARSIAK